jgi:D-methionine transport system substrate-binding protein
VSAVKNDIEQNSKNFKFAELEAAQLPRSLEDTDLSIVNGNYALQINLKPSKVCSRLRNSTK